jgi:hypothetical protein
LSRRSAETSGRKNACTPSSNRRPYFVKYNFPDEVSRKQYRSPRCSIHTWFSPASNSSDCSKRGAAALAGLAPGESIRG